MSQVLVVTSAEDGFVNNVSGIYPSETFVIASTSSSSDAIENQAFWFFNTADGVTGLPASAVIHRVRLLVFPTASYEPSMGSPVWYFYACNDACNGSTLSADDFGRPTTFQSNLQSGWQLGKYGYIELNPACINRSGFTDVRCKCVAADTPGGSVTFDAVEKPGGNPAKLLIHYNIPEGANALLLGGK